MAEVCSLPTFEEYADLTGFKADRARLLSDASTGVDSECHEWTKLRFLALASDLLQGFSKPSFQADLKKLFEDTSGNSFVQRRMELALTVQSEVLPMHGLPGSFEGVLDMLDVMAAFLADPEALQMINNIDEVLGLPRHFTASAITGPPVTKNVSLSRAQVLMMSAELLNAFRASEFQEKLSALCSPGTHSGHVLGRADLAMTVQCEVFPKYGIPGSSDGILIMLESLFPSRGDCTVVSALNAIDEALGQAPGTALSSLPQQSTP